MVQIIVMTADNQYHCLPGYCHQFDKYFGMSQVETIFCGYSPLPKLDHPHKFYSIGDFADYPANKWSDAFIRVLDNVADEVFILMLEDYWLVRQVDTRAIQMIHDYMHQFQNVLRFDLTEERLYAGTPPNGGYNRFYWGYNTYDTLGHLDLIQSSPDDLYHMSLWGAMWRRDLLRQVLVSGERAQEIEMYGGARLLTYPEWLVLGTRQAPMRHVNVVQRGEWNMHDRSGLPGMKESDVAELGKLGYLRD